MIKPRVRLFQRDDGVMIVDDSILDEPNNRRKRDCLPALRPCQRANG
jgi:hypothetical protein